MKSLGIVSKGAGLALLVGVLPACSIFVGSESEKVRETRHSSVNHVSGAGLRVKNSNGSIRAVQAHRADVGIVARLCCRTQERLDATRIVAEREGDLLSVYVEWADGRRRNGEGCSFEVQLPEAVGVELRSSNGALECVGLGGEASLHTSNGRIEIADHAGPVVACTSNGKIVAEEVSESMELRTSNGSIRAVNVVSPVVATTSNGSVSLELATDFSGEMSANTSNAKLDVSGLDNARLISSSKQRVVFAMGDSATKSRVSTSNGSVRIKTVGM